MNDIYPELIDGNDDFVQFAFDTLEFLVPRKVYDFAMYQWMLCNISFERFMKNITENSIRL